MRIEELEVICQEAARELVAREDRPLPPAAVLPLPQATRVTTFPDFPLTDPERYDLLAAFARDVLRPADAPAFGFVAEAAADGEDGPIDVVVVVYGARNHHLAVTAAPFTSEGLGAFTPAEELDHAAFPFLAPLRHAVDVARPPGAVTAPPG